MGKGEKFRKPPAIKYFQQNWDIASPKALCQNVEIVQKENLISECSTSPSKFVRIYFGGVDRGEYVSIKWRGGG